MRLGQRQLLGSTAAVARAEAPPLMVAYYYLVNGIPCSFGLSIYNFALFVINIIFSELPQFLLGELLSQLLVPLFQV